MINYQRLILVGNANGDLKRHLSNKDKSPYSVFQLEVKSGMNQPTSFTVLAFGVLAEKAAQAVIQGRSILVEGRLAVSQRGQLNVIADQLRFEAPVENDKA